MMKYDVIATVGKYQKDGQTRYLTKNVGRVLTLNNGQVKLLLDASFNPAGCERGEDGKVWLSLFEPKQEVKQDNFDDLDTPF